MRKTLNIGPTAHAETRQCPFQFTAPSLAGPERLVGLGFRYWMLGHSTGDIACWERAWELYSGAFALIETSIIDGVVEQAQDFADTLTGLDHILSPGAIVRAPVNMALSHATAH